MYIDPHVHCRDEEQSDKETIQHALSVAEKAGVDAIFDMPNTTRPIISRQRVVKRFELAKAANSPVFYGVYVGLTSDPNQIREAVRTSREFFPRPEDSFGVIGLKLFAGKSVGNLAVIDEKSQRQIYQELGKLNYQEVLAVHCEKEALIKPELWDSRVLYSHSLARPPEAELESIKDQVNFAQSAGFRGTLHIAHISTPESVDYLSRVKGDVRTGGVCSSLKITCGATPHHLFLHNRIPQCLGKKLFLKVNPPLREEEEQKELLKRLGQGKIDWIETDHAPHTVNEKLQEPFMSGIPGLDQWPVIPVYLKNKGLSEEQIADLTFNNVSKTFGLERIISKSKRAEEVGGTYPTSPYYK